MKNLYYIAYFYVLKRKYLYIYILHIDKLNSLGNAEFCFGVTIGEAVKLLDFHFYFIGSLGSHFHLEPRNHDNISSQYWCHKYPSKIETRHKILNILRTSDWFMM